MPIKNIGKRISALRKYHKLNQAALAKLLDIRQSDVSKIENGHREVHLSEIDIVFNKFKPNESWYFLGEGSMYDDENATEVNDFQQAYHNSLINFSGLELKVKEIESRIDRLENK